MMQFSCISCTDPSKDPFCQQNEVLRVEKPHLLKYHKTREKCIYIYILYIYIYIHL